MGYAGSVSADGWYFTTATERIPEEDPVEFRLEVLVSGNGDAWRELEAPPWWPRRASARVPLARGATMLLDLRPPWQWVLQQCVGFGVLAAAWLAALLLSAQGNGRRAVLGAATGIGTFALLNLCAAVHDSIFGDEDARDLALLRWFAFIELAVLMCAFLEERHILEAIVVFSPLFGVMLLLQQRLCFPNPILPWLTGSMPMIWVTFPTATAVVLIVIRGTAGRWVRDHLLAEDRRVYGALWQATVNADANVGALERLAARTRAVAASLQPELVRQRHRLRLIPGPGYSSDDGWTSVWQSSYLRRGASAVTGPVRPRVRCCLQM